MQLDLMSFQLLQSCEVFRKIQHRLLEIFFEGGICLFADGVDWLERIGRILKFDNPQLA